MILQVSMECSIVTDNVILSSSARGRREGTDGGHRQGLDRDRRPHLPIVSQSRPPQPPPPPGDETDKVTFCNRVFNRTVQDAEDPEDGYDRSRDYLATKSANAFNWVRLNMGSGVHEIKLYADLSHFATAGSTASAFVGNRSMIGQPGKFSNDATINEGGTG
ncbi:MAG: hypothetical protein KY439_03525 [Actinobacteria bacterium]|nr:hypothetical protein [Actinomycetota bacterium]